MVCWGCLSVGAQICFSLKMNGRAGLVLPIGEAAVEVKFAPQRYDASAAVGRGSSGRFALMEVLHRYAQRQHFSEAQLLSAVDGTTGAVRPRFIVCLVTARVDLPTFFL